MGDVRGGRRTFLKGIAASVPVAGLAPRALSAERTSPAASAPPSARTRAMERGPPEGYDEAQAARYFVREPGSDLMVDALRGLGIEYIAVNPGSTFRGLQESVVTYGGNRQPELIACLHEESAVAMAHGYAKAAGKPMAVACHGTVGLQHAAMAVYNAWCDRAPVVILAGNHLDATQRYHRVTWAHAVQDTAHIVRDFTKWDDTPVSLPHFLESLVRAYKIATTPPAGPVVIVADAHLQEQDLAGGPRPAIPALAPVTPPRADDGALAEVAALLAAAERPVIIADRAARTAAGMARLVELAETLQAPVVDQLGRLNFPNTHYLNHTFRARALIGAADVILGLEMTDMWGSVHRLLDLPHPAEVRIAPEGCRLVSLGVGHLYLKSNYQNFARYAAVDLAVSGDAEASLPALTEHVRRALGRNAGRRLSERGERLRKAYAEQRARERAAARYAWDASPVSTARLCMELWRQIEHRDWALVSDCFFQSQWPHRLWAMDRYDRYLGGSGGYGVGYGAPAAAGAALALRGSGRIPVNIQPDGDLLYGPGVLWTAAHHDLPLLSVMHNNRGYHQEVMHLQRMALTRERGADGNARVGNVFDEPHIDFAQVARGLGVWSSGPIEDPAELTGALRRALAVVEAGEPALVDVVCQPR